MQISKLLKKTRIVFGGRVSRLSYFKGLIFGAVPLFALSSVYALLILLLNILGFGGGGGDYASALGSMISSVLTIVMALLALALFPWTIAYMFCLNARRFRDIGLHWAFVFTLLIPYVNWLVLLLLLVVPTRVGSDTLKNNTQPVV